MFTFPSSDPEATKESSKGLLQDNQRLSLRHDFEPTERNPPIRVQHSRSMSSEQGHLFRQPPFLIDWYNRECASSASFPIDRDVVRVGLNQISASHSRLQLLGKLTLTIFVSQAFFEICRLS